LATGNGELVDEGQSIEFKESLGSARRQEGTQTLVAFANADGGRVFFGIENDGRVRGVQVGQKTLEDLANEIAQHTYPSLLAHIEQLEFGDMKVVMVKAARDTPRVVGVYLYSTDPIQPDKPVDTAKLQAYRRVGRTNQKEDFMRLRQPASSAPEIVLRLNGAGGTAGQHFPKQQGFYYSNNGPGWAYNVSFRAEHNAYRVSTAPIGINLPPPGQENEHYRRHPRRSTVERLDPDEERPGADQPLCLRVTYQDSAGFTWQSILELIPTRRASEEQLYDFRQGNLARRIMVLPPKSSISR